MSAPSDKNQPIVEVPIRWQFSLRRLLAAMLAVAIVFSLANWAKWPGIGSVVGFTTALVASILVRSLSRVALGCLAIVFLTIAALWIRETVFTRWVGPLGRWPEDLCLGLIRAGLYASSAVLLRVQGGVQAWQLVGSLVAFEVLFFAIVVEQAGFAWGEVFLGERYASEFVLSWFLVQRWYIVVPWLLGTGLAETLARRKTRSRPCQSS